MNVFSKLFNKKATSSESAPMEDFMTLLRVYLQGALATSAGINSPTQLPEMMAFKRMLKVPTVNNRLGVGEKKACQRMMQDLWGISDSFFKEIDASVKRSCKRPQDVPPYLYAFQGFSQETVMLMGNLLKWKFRIPSFLKGLLRKVTNQTVSDVWNKQDWTDAATWKSVQSVRTYAKRLGFSQEWAAEFVYSFIILAKKSPRPSEEEVKKAEAKMKK